METSTRLGSRVVIDVITPTTLYGRWFDGVSEWYPYKWNAEGKVWSGDRVCSLDIVWPSGL